MSEVVRTLAVVHGWSASVPNLSDKLKRGTLRYSEAIELADVLGYDIVCHSRHSVFVSACKSSRRGASAPY
jgi:hypothetical protein